MEATPRGKRTCGRCKLEKKEKYFITKDGRIVNTCDICRPKNIRAAILKYDRIMLGGLLETVLKRDGYKCVKCGMTNEQHLKTFSYRLTIDHIDGRGKHTPIEQKNNNLDNLQTLCAVCHGKKDGTKILKLHRNTYRNEVGHFTSCPEGLV